MSTAVSVTPSVGPTAVSISANLIEASYRSDDFPSDWTREQREHALDRYQRWLGLKQRTRCVSRRRFAQRARLALFTRARIPQRTFTIALRPAES